MDSRPPGFPVLHCLLEFAQTHVHCVDDAIQPSHPLYVFLKVLKLIDYFWPCCVFAAACGLFLIEVSRGYCPGVVCGLLISMAFLLQSTESRVHGPQQLWITRSRARAHSCSAAAWLPMWNLPGPGIKPMSPALATRFLTTGPPGKS